MNQFAMLLFSFIVIVISCFSTAFIMNESIDRFLPTTNNSRWILTLSGFTLFLCQIFLLHALAFAAFTQ